VAEGARLESVYTVFPYRGFESLSLRHIFLPHIIGKRCYIIRHCEAVLRRGNPAAFSVAMLDCRALAGLAMTNDAITPLFI
jgi:hypothetical protein